VKPIRAAFLEFRWQARAARPIGTGMRLYDYDGSANGYKVRLLIRQCGIACERTEVDIFRGEARTAEFLKRNAMGQVPTLELDDGRCIAESNAILWHLARGTSLLPEGAYEQSKVLQWLFFEQYNVEPTIGSARFWILTGRAKARGDELGRRVDAGTAALGVMEGVLSREPFFVANRYTIADIALYAYSHLAADAGIDLGKYAAVKAWFARVEGQPRFQPGPGAYGATAHATAS
jgi:glutathione S-transferase